MRMTNKIMQNNSLYNINNNKTLQDKLSTQMSTQKKITRPSDDPVIAIRALRLRSDVAQISQYHEKNAPDAESWLDVTADALNTTTDVLKSMIEQSTSGSNMKLGASDLDIIVTQLKSLRDEFYATGNVDFAGRFVFTGYRTDTSLSYTEDTTQNFEILEKMHIGAVDTINYTSVANLPGISKENFTVVDETKIDSNDIFRIRLSYDDLKEGPIPPMPRTSPAVQYVDASTNPPTTNDLIPPADIEIMSSTATPDNPYDYILKNPTKAVLIPETGELLIGETLYDTMKTTAGDNEIQVTYEKDTWKDGDMRPEHYFACKDLTTGIEYNYGDDSNGIIQYDVGYNQKIRINTKADEVFTLGLDRNIDDMEKALETLKDIEKSKSNLKDYLKNKPLTDPDYEDVKNSLSAAEKAYTFIRENVQKMFEGLTTKIQGTLDDTSVAITDNGTRGSRLELVSSRLMAQKTTFKTLQSANEDIDVTEVTIQLTSMEYSYQSALLATSKIMQNSLMNYI